MKEIERLKEIIQLASKLGWLIENSKGYPLMSLSEVEKCMLAMTDDFELNRMQQWARKEESKDK